MIHSIHSSIPFISFIHSIHSFIHSIPFIHPFYSFIHPIHSIHSSILFIHSFILSSSVLIDDVKRICFCWSRLQKQIIKTCSSSHFKNLQLMNKKKSINPSINQSTHQSFYFILFYKNLFIYVSICLMHWEGHHDSFMNDKISFKSCNLRKKILIIISFFFFF